MDSDGKRRWQVVPGQLKDALTALADVQQRQRKGERVAPTKVKFGEFADAWLAAQTNLRDNTRRTYTWALSPTSSRRSAIDASRRSRRIDVTDLIAKLQADGKKPWSIRGILTPLSRVLASAARKGVIASTRQPPRAWRAAERSAHRDEDPEPRRDRPAARRVGHRALPPDVRDGRLLRSARRRAARAHVATSTSMRTCCASASRWIASPASAGI